MFFDTSENRDIICNLYEDKVYDCRETYGRIGVKLTGSSGEKGSELLNAAELEILDNTSDMILSLVDKGLNDIWIFMLHNIYVPIVLTESKFDILVINPPLDSGEVCGEQELSGLS
ncbi:MAG: hypothetical protein QXI52_07410 [Nitrososphaerota archaeon]